MTRTEHDAEVRRRLIGVAYRLVGSRHDAEDAVQEALLRWHRLTEEQRGLVREPLAWLTRVVSRICLDQLKSAQARREETAGVRLPEPLIGDESWLPLADGRRPDDPLGSVTLDESVSFAFLTALERLTPAERVSFILHEVFDVPYADIAVTVGRSPAACRQLAASARRHLASERRYEVDPQEKRRVVTGFLDACRNGDLHRLVSLLDPDVVSIADGGSAVRVAGRPVVGADAVARYLLRILAHRARRTDGGVDARVDTVNGRPGIVVRAGDELIAAVDLAVRDGVVSRIAIQVDPVKLSGARLGWGL